VGSSLGEMRFSRGPTRLVARMPALFILLFAVVAESATHWAYLPVKAPEVDSLDALVEAAEPEVDRRALFRRLSWVLTGLPPSVEKLREFLADESPDALEKAADRLLASPAYGERWGRRWLDVVRYADSNGQDENKAQAEAWRYRDYVVNAFNADMPFDQFTREQIAGDLIPYETEADRLRGIVATGFLVIGPKRLAEQDKAKMRFDIIDEQIDTIGRGFLGISFGCARCHDHFFDPVSQRDYFAMAGILSGTQTMADEAHVSKWMERDIAPADHRQFMETHKKELAQVEAELSAVTKAADAAIAPRMREHAERYLRYALRPETDLADLNPEMAKLWRQKLAVYRTLPDTKIAEFATQLVAWSKIERIGQHVPGKIGAALAAGSPHIDVPHAPELEPEQFTLMCYVRRQKPVKIHDNRRWLVNKNGSEWHKGHYSLFTDGAQFGAYFAPEGGQSKQVSLRSKSDVLPMGKWTHLACSFDGKNLRIFANGKEVGKAKVDRPWQHGDGHLRIGGRADDFNACPDVDIDEVRLYGRALTAAEIAKPGDAGLIRAWPLEPKDPGASELLAEPALWSIVGEIFAAPKKSRDAWTVEERQAIDALAARKKALADSAPTMMRAMAVQEGKPTNLKLQHRGNHLNLSGNPVPRGVPRELLSLPIPEMPIDSSGRVQLADWIANSANPLTARVMANRIWQGHFGDGLVRTANDFGIRGEAPRNPKLLDWLASEFVRSGWSVKAMHRLIIRSAAWQAQRPPVRIDAEMVRDGLLSVSGLLDPALGGVVGKLKNHGYFPKNQSFESHRRALYMPIVRDRLDASLEVFDFAQPSRSTGVRDRSILPQQTLYLLNSRVATESAKALAESVGGQLDLLYEKVLSRPPSADERVAGAKLADELGWDALCQALFTSNEFLYIP
jgi:hypothetical protein